VGCGGCGEGGEGGVSVHKWDCGARVGFGDIWVGTLGGGIVKWVALVQYVCISTGVSRNGGWRRWIGWFLAI